jgi:hypothetical protein
LARLNLAAILQFVLAVGDHNVAGIQAGSDPSNVPVRLGECDDVNFHFIIRSNRERVSSLGAA